MLRQHIIENIEFYRISLGLIFMFSFFLMVSKDKNRRTGYTLMFFSSFPLSIIYDYQNFEFGDHMFFLMSVYSLIQVMQLNKEKKWRTRSLEKNFCYKIMNV